MIRSLLPACALALLAAPCTAQAGDLSGTVRDSAARPVAGVAVTIPDLGLSVTTDEEGRYRFTDLAAGEHRVAVELADDARQHTSVQVPETGEATRNLFLYSRVALDHARSGINPVEAMLADVLMAQAWEEASEMTAQAERLEPQALPDFAG